METRRFNIGVVSGLVVLTLFALVIVAYALTHSRNIPRFYLPYGGNVLKNGSFEEGPFQPNKSGGIMSLDAGSTTMPGWTVVGGTLPDGNTQEVAWIVNSDKYAGATDGKLFLDLTGAFDRKLKGFFSGVRQTFAIVPHNAYRLSFDIMVANPDFPGPITVKALMSTTPDGEAYAQATCTNPLNPSGPRNQTMTCTKDFRAAEEASTILTIKGVDGIHNYIGLDNVSVQCLAPLGLSGFCPCVSDPSCRH